MAESEREFKAVGFPAALYEHLRDFANAEDATNRGIIRTAVEKHLGEVLELCAKAGFAPAEGERKLVRTPIDPGIKKLLDEAAEKSGLDATTLMLCCLRRTLGLRLKDPDRDSILARIKRRLARSRS